MPEKQTVERAKKDLREGKAPTTAAGEFVREEVKHVRAGKHGARSPQQAIAIGLSRARRAGVPLEPPAEGTTKRSTRKSAERDYATGQGKRKPRAPSAQRSRATKAALSRERRSSASKTEMGKQARRASARRKAATGTRSRPSVAAKRSRSTTSARKKK